MKKGFIPIVIVLAVVLITAVSGFAFDKLVLEKKQKPAEDISNSESSPSPAVSPVASAVQSPSATTSKKTSSNPGVQSSPGTSSNQNSISTSTQTRSTEVKIDSVSTTSGKAGEQIMISGSNFGSESGMVLFTASTSGGCCGVYADSWSDSVIKVKVISFGAKGERQLSVQRKDGKTSNAVIFNITAGQPYVNTVSPTQIKAGGTLTISGEELGSSFGSLDFYEVNSATNKLAQCTSGSWSETSISCSIPGSLSAGNEYGVQVTTNDSRQSSFKYITVTN